MLPGVVYDTYGDPMTNAASAKPNLPALDYDYCKGVLEQVCAGDGRAGRGGVRQ
jgi:hypothetical protein